MGEIEVDTDFMVEVVKLGKECNNKCMLKEYLRLTQVVRLNRSS